MVETATLHNWCLHLLQVGQQWRAEPSSKKKTTASSFNQMANTYSPSDLDFLFEYIADLASDDSDYDFDGYLLSEEEPEEPGKIYVTFL